MAQLFFGSNVITTGVPTIFLMEETSAVLTSERKCLYRVLNTLDAYHAACMHANPDDEGSIPVEN